jgi:hypothetical protein
MKRARKAVGILLALMMLLGAVPAFSASPQRDSALDAALNYETCNFTYTTYYPQGGGIETVTEGGRTYAVLYANEGGQDDITTWVKTRVVAKQGDLFGFDHASTLDYMDGATVGFGYMNGSEYVELYTNEEESGDGYYDGETVSEWETFQYQIPADGEYEFMWRIDAYNPYSRFAVDDVYLYPTMTVDRALNAQSSALSWENDPSFPWAPAFNNGRICMKSGAISHNDSTSLVSNSVILREGDVFSADIATDSESGYDKLNVYYTRTSDASPAETLIQAYSGTGGAWGTSLSWPVPSDGTYSFRFEYKKDTSVSSGGDCVYVSNAFARRMGLARAAAPGFENEIEFSTYNQGSYYSFDPAWVEGEIVLESQNKGVHSTAAILFFGAELAAGESIAFDYSLDSEDRYDVLKLLSSDQETEYFIRNSDTNGFETYTFTADAYGEYNFLLTYVKDSSVSQGRDTALVKNFRIIPDDLSAAMRRDDCPYLEFTRGTNGSQIELVEDGERYYAQVSNFTNYAVASIGGYRNANEYVIFDYKVTGDDAKLEFWAYDGTENEFYSDGSNEWHTYYYRLPASGGTPLDWLFQPGENGTVCVDNVYIGYINISLAEALNHPDTDCAVTEIEVVDFIGHYDPYEPRGVTKYAYCDPVAGNSAALEWGIQACAGDEYEFIFRFFDEDGEPNGSSFDIWMDGEHNGTFYDANLGTNWWMMRVNFNRDGVHTFRIDFYSEGTMGGDGFAISRSKLDSLGVSLDEALNAEGGTIHFSEPEEGGFRPFYDVETEVYAGAPIFTCDPESELYLDYSFETAAEIGDWAFTESDGDGNTFIPGVCSGYAGYPAADGYYALISGPVVEQGSPVPHGVDNWAITPEFTVPLGGISGSWISFLYAAVSAQHPETLEIYVLPEGEIENAELLYTVVAADGDWENLGLSLMNYEGQTIAVGFRHCTEASAFGLMLDCVCIDCAMPYYAELTFTEELRVCDRVSFDMRVEDFDDDGEIEGNMSIAIFEDGVNVMNYDGQSLYANYGQDWSTCSLPFPASGGGHTYRIVISWLEENYPDHTVYLDNFRIESFANEICSIEITDYAVPAAGTTPLENVPSVPGGLGYHIDRAVWYGEDEFVMDDDELFEAGESYTLMVRVVAEDGYEFADEVFLYVENDPNAELVALTATQAVIAFTQVTISSAGIPGDVDGNGLVNMADLALAASYVQNSGAVSAQGILNGDMNGDGVLSAADLAALYSMILG